MKRFYLFGGIAALMFAAVAGAAAYDTIFHGRLVVGLVSNYSAPTCTAATGDGELCVAGDIESNGNLDIAGTITSGGAFSQSGDLTLSGGVGALTFSGSTSSIVVDDNDATALLVGSTGQLGLLTLDTADATETVVINGTTTTDAFHVNVGDAQFDEDIACTGDVTINGGVGALTLSGSGDSSFVLADNDSTALAIGSTGQLGLLTLDTGDSAETVVINGTTTTDALHVNVGDAQFDEDIACTGDVTVNGGVGALTLSGSGDSSIVLADNDATALVVGATGALNILTVDTTDATPGVIATGYLKSTAGLISSGIESNMTAGACTAGTWQVDNTGTRELCRCNDAGSAYDCVSVTTANGPSD